MKNKTKKISVTFLYILLSLFLIINNNVMATEDSAKEEQVEKEALDNLEFDKYVSTINDYVKESGIEEIDLNQITSELITNKKLDNESILKKILNIFAKEILVTARSSILIYIIIIIMAIITSFDLEENGDITKIAKMVCFLALSTVTITSFLEIISSFKKVVSILTTTMQVISPFLLAVLMATGALSTTGVIQPIILFLASAIGFLVNYVVIPFFLISVAFNVIYSISENLRISKVSKLFSSSAIWFVGVLFSGFLGVLSLETSLTTSVDSLTVKTTQAAVSNFVPVVGKFFSDSFETVVGATKIIGKTGGVIGIIAIILISAIPIIRVASITIIYSILNTLIEPIYSDEKVLKYMENFANIYKTLLGVLIGIVILFIISTGIILNLVSKVVV